MVNSFGVKSHALFHPSHSMSSATSNVHACRGNLELVRQQSNCRAYGFSALSYRVNSSNIRLRLGSTEQNDKFLECRDGRGR